MSTTRTRITVAPLYPGSLFPEDGRPVEIPDTDSATALAAVADDGRWFALEVRTTPQKRWTDGDGGELWTSTGEGSSYRIYAGESFTVADVEQLPGDYSILLSNMRGNGWAKIVRTRRGNWQPLEGDDVVIAMPTEARA